MHLDRSECVKILENVKKGENAQLLHYNVKRDRTAVGYLGDYYSLTIEYCSAYFQDVAVREVHLFIKALPVLSEEAKKDAIFQKEAWLYDTLLADLKKCSRLKWSADCYYTRSDLLVLENITLRGYKSSESATLSDAHMSQLIQSLAAFHAASLVYEHRTECSIGQAYGDHLMEITVDAEIAWFTTGLSALLATIRSLPQYQGDQELSFVDSKLPGILEEIYEQAAPSKKYRNVLCHRDLWSGNVFFPPDPSEPALLIDYQTCRYTPPASDLNFCLYLNLTSKDRRKKERRFIDLYYSHLEENLLHFGLKDLLISKEELLESYEDFRLFGGVYRAVAATIVKVPQEFITNDFKYVDRKKEILHYMQTNREFRAYMEECCVDVMEMAVTRGK
ncbi:hypothetical protein KR018_007928 [Drosophila ironensis]|nr:hypothetical protein KR018_007928 [Drosophila ironensis]